MTTAYQADILNPDTEYNGWTNYETWNAALWIGNDEGLYSIARRAMDWDHLLEIFTMYGTETTGDGVRWDDPKINAVEMDEMLGRCNPLALCLGGAEHVSPNAVGKSERPQRNMLFNPNLYRTPHRERTPRGSNMPLFYSPLTRQAISKMGHFPNLQKYPDDR